MPSPTKTAVETIDAIVKNGFDKTPTFIHVMKKLIPAEYCAGNGINIYAIIAACNESKSKVADLAKKGKEKVSSLDTYKKDFAEVLKRFVWHKDGSRDEEAFKADLKAKDFLEFFEENKADIELAYKKQQDDKQTQKDRAKLNKKKKLDSEIALQKKLLAKLDPVEDKDLYDATQKKLTSLANKKK